MSWVTSWQTRCVSKAFKTHRYPQDSPTQNLGQLLSLVLRCLFDVCTLIGLQGVGIGYWVLGIPPAVLTWCLVSGVWFLLSPPALLSPDTPPAIWGPAVSSHCPCPSAGRKDRAVPSGGQPVAGSSHPCSQPADWSSSPSKGNCRGILERKRKI